MARMACFIVYYPYRVFIYFYIYICVTFTYDADYLAQIQGVRRDYLTINRLAMMDIFADALSDTSLLSDDSQLRSSTAPSQDTVFGRSASFGDDPIMLSDEDDAINPGTIAVHVPDGDTIGDIDSQTTDCNSRDDCQPPRAKRRHVSEKPPQFHTVPSIGTTSVMCVFVPREGKSPVPVPLWDQYTVTWHGQDLGIAKWIVVSTQERWLMKVVDEVTQKHAKNRLVAKTFMDRCRNEFLTCLAIARRHKVIDDAFEVAHEEDKSTTMSSNVDRVQDRHAVRGRHNIPEVIVQIGGFELVCLNHGSRIALKLCEGTVEFIAAWVVPVLRELARSQDSQPCEATTATQSDSSTPQGFHFCASSTPNHRDKVHWNPYKHSWEVLLKKAKAPMNEKFVVDPHLEAAPYDEQKLARYVAAIATWNRLDGSSRHRIHSPPIALL